jgi:hypothetical protein
MENETSHGTKHKSMGKKYFYMTINFPLDLNMFFLKLTVKRKHLVVFVGIQIYCCISAVC